MVYIRPGQSPVLIRPPPNPDVSLMSVHRLGHRANVKPTTNQHRGFVEEVEGGNVSRGLWVERVVGRGCESKGFIKKISIDDSITL